MLRISGLVLATATLLVSSSTWASDSHPILAIGSAAPDFSLPGTDGATHHLNEYASSPVLMIVFTCNHCPIAQMYEQRIQRIADEYKGRGVAVVAIQPNDPIAIRIDELDSSDVSDTLAEMKIRVQFKHLTYPYLYDGETQEVTRAYGPQATPHAFIFDEHRILRYEGRIDNSYRTELVKNMDARDAIDALLAHREVAIAHTGAFGCSTKWAEKSQGRITALDKIEQQPVTLNPVSKAELTKLRSNPDHRLLLIDFWATWCTSCIAEFSDIQDTLRMYADRDLSLVTVSVNTPDEQAGVQRFLEKKHATSRNLIFSSADTTALQQAFDPTWDSAVPYTILLSSDGKVLYKTIGDADLLELRRIVLANAVAEYSGFNDYWKNN